MARRRKSRRRSTRKYRRNPVARAKAGTKNYVRGLTTAPQQVMALFKGKNKVKNITFTAVGTMASYLAGGFVATQAAPILARVPGVSNILANPMGQRVVGALFPYTIGFTASRFMKGEAGKALHLGGAIAAIVEMINPGMVGRFFSRIPGINTAVAAVPAVATSPVEGLQGYFGNDMMLAGYTTDLSYRGASGYEMLPGYRGASMDGYETAEAYRGASMGGLGEYKDAPAYAGTGEEDALAGTGMGSFLDEASMFQPAI